MSHITNYYQVSHYGEGKIPSNVEKASRADWKHYFLKDPREQVP